MDVRAWPGEPETVWQTVDADPYDMPDRPEMPPWRSREDFRTHVDVVREHTVLGIALILLAVVFIVAGWFAARGVDTGWEGVAKDIVGGVMVVLGLTGIVGGIAMIAFGRWGWEGYLDFVHHKVLDHGIPVHAYACPLHANAGELSDPTTLLIDARVSDATAARLYAAATLWLDRATAERKIHHDTVEAFASREVLPLAEVLGEDAAGAWIARDRATDTPWRLLVPDESAKDGFGLGAVIAVRDPERRKDPEPFRLPSRVTVVDWLMSMAILVAGALAYWRFQARTNSTNYWWEACADKFCAVGHDLRLMALLGVGVALWLWGFWPLSAFRRRNLRWLWAVLMVVGVTASLALSAYFSRVHPLE